MTQLDDGSPSDSPAPKGRRQVARTPLYVRVRETLRDMINSDFQDGQKFLTEAVLMQQLGVSQGTVRHALAELTREEMLVRIVPQGTFVRKSAGQAWDIRLIVPQAEFTFLVTILEQFVVASQEKQLNLRFHLIREGETATDVLRLFQGSPAHQRIIMLGITPPTTRGLYMALAKRGYRTVNVDNLEPGCGDVYIGVDNDVGIRLGMKHLMDLGHRRITLLENEPSTRGNPRARVQSFQAVAEEEGLTQADVVVCDSQPREEAIRDALGRILEQKKWPTALFTVSDMGAWVVLKVLAERGIKVPDQISVLGFNDEPASRFMFPALSTLAQPFEDMARQALELSIQSEAPTGLVLLPPSLVVRATTGPAPT